MIQRDSDDICLFVCSFYGVRQVLEGQKDWHFAEEKLMTGKLKNGSMEGNSHFGGSMFVFVVYSLHLSLKTKWSATEAAQQPKLIYLHPLISCRLLASKILHEKIFVTSFPPGN